jgi:hypothetical protein
MLFRFDFFDISCLPLLTPPLPERFAAVFQPPSPLSLISPMTPRVTSAAVSRHSFAVFRPPDAASDESPQSAFRDLFCRH